MLRGNTRWSFQNYTKDTHMGIGLTEGLLIAAIALLLFGGKKIPQLGKTLGASIKGFKEGMNHDPAATESDKKVKVEIIEEKKKKS